MFGWPKSEWIAKEYIKQFPEGGSILIKGWECVHCKSFVHRKTGQSKYCPSCGYLMKNFIEDSNKLNKK